jgi:hypothetical protein
VRSVPVLAAFALSLAIPAYSQTTPQPPPAAIAGVVIDDRTERPIPGALVYVEGNADAASTDADGRFTMTLPRGRHTIIASVIGYALLRTNVEAAAAPIEMTIRLSEGAGAYTERVSVSGSFSGDADAVAGSTSLHGRELENLRGAVLDDPLRAIHALPSATATDDFYSEFAVRGSSFRSINLVLDGVPTPHLMHAVNGISDGGSIAMINSESLAAVSLLPGSYPQRTGRRLGAEVDLVTREGRRDRFHARAGLSGTAATFLGEGGIRREQGSWLVSVRRSYLDYLIRRIDPDAGFAFGFVDTQARVTYDLTPRHKVSLTTLVGRGAFKEGDPDIGVDEIRTAVSYAWFASVSWRYLPNDRFAITQRAFSTGLRFDNDNRDGAALDAARSSELGWRADASLALTPHLLVEFGGDALRLDGRSETVRDLSPADPRVAVNAYQERATAVSAYGQVRLGIGSRMTVTTGSRVDRWALTDSANASPWATFELRAGKYTRVRGGSGLYHQFPDLDQVHGLNAGAGLRPERALHADAGLEQSIGHETRLLVNVYGRRETGVLWRPDLETRLAANGSIQPPAPTAAWANALNGDAHGLEIVVRRDATQGVTGWAAYAFGRFRYTRTATGERFWADADQRHTVTLYGNHRLSSRSSLSARYRYGSNYPIAGYIGEPSPALGGVPSVDGRPLFYGLTAERNSLRLPAYSRLDVRADRAFNWSGRRLVVFVDVANVLNHTNVRNSSYSVDRRGRVFGTMESLMPIVPSGGLVVEF